MFVEPLQARGLFTADVPVDTWDRDELRRDGVWLAAADLWLRRSFLRGAELGSLQPTLEYVRVAGACFGTELLDGPDGSAPPRYARPEDVFLFSGDLLAWRTAAGERLGRPAEYLALARRIGAASTRRWPATARRPATGTRRPERFARLQALIWSVQSIRAVRAAAGQRPARTSAAADVREILDELGLLE